MVLLQKPQHQEARYWLIVRRVQDGEGETAMKDMQSLYRSLPDDSPLKAMINRKIGRE
jgi:cytochrome c-type biogenesis protein CcmH/NrfG